MHFRPSYPGLPASDEWKPTRKASLLRKHSDHCPIVGARRPPWNRAPPHRQGATTIGCAEKWCGPSRAPPHFVDSSIFVFRPPSNATIEKGGRCEDRCCHQLRHCSSRAMVPWLPKTPAEKVGPRSEERRVGKECRSTR